MNTRHDSTDPHLAEESPAAGETVDDAAQQMTGDFSQSAAGTGSPASGSSEPTADAPANEETQADSDPSRS